MNFIGQHGIAIDNEYAIGDEVYIRTDPDRGKGIVVGVTVRPFNLVYEVSQGASMATFYAFELAKEHEPAAS